MADSTLTSGHDDHSLLEYLANLLLVALGVKQSRLDANGGVVRQLLVSTDGESAPVRFRRFLEGQQTALYVHKYAPALPDGKSLEGK